MLSLNSFGQVVLRILNGHASKLVFAGDVLLYVGQQHEREQRFYGPYRFDQTTIDRLCHDDDEFVWINADDRIHQIIGDCARSLRFDRWQAARKDAALALRVVVDIVVAPLADVLSDDQRALLDHARKMLSREVMECLENGYSVLATSKKLGIARHTLDNAIRRLRPSAA